MTLDAMKAVYTYLSKEIWQIMDEVRLPYEAFLTTTPAEEIQKHIATQGISLDIPKNKDGTISLDDIHTPIIKRVNEIYSELVPNLDRFSYSYPTSGSSEGLREIMKTLSGEGVKEINVLKGEYEGYGFNAGFYGMKANSVDISDILNTKPGYWFISNPSARDGNIIPNETINELCENGNKVILDLAYVGSTKPNVFDIEHENIPYVVMSLSKPFGLFRYRIGFTYSQDEIPALYGNRWFKDAERFVQGLAVLEKIGPYKQNEKFKGTQEKIIEEMNNTYGLSIKPSDSFLLGYLNSEDTEKYDDMQKNLISEFQREDKYRFCITPALSRKLGGISYETTS